MIFLKDSRSFHLNIRSNYISPYSRPQSNGSIERFHRTLKQYLRHYVDLDLNNWDEYVKLAYFAYNTSVHSSTNFTPFELIYGKKANVPSSFTKEMNNEKFYGYDDYIKRLINNMGNYTAAETFKNITTLQLVFKF